jgi:hypothetical protein
MADSDTEVPMMTDDFIFKLGKKAKREDTRTLQLSAYLTGAAAPPDHVDWGSKVDSWRMLGNNEVGDCAWAGQAHADMLWTSSTRSAAADISTKEVLAAYSAVTGYNPKDNGPKGNPTDQGTTLIDALKYWRTHGIAGRTIKAFVELNPKNVEHVKAAIDLFGCVYIGVELPDAVLPNGASDIPHWTVTPNGEAKYERNADNGHCVIYSAYDGKGPTVISWGTTVQASWPFHVAYCDEAYAMVSPEWITKRGVDPQSLDLAALEHDLAAIGPAGRQHGN